MKDERSQLAGAREVGKRKSGGRNNRGRITVRHHGGGHRRRIRELEKEERSGVVVSVEYDPNRTAYLGKSKVYGGRLVNKILGIVPSSREVLNMDMFEGREIRVAKLELVRAGEVVYKVGLREGQAGKIGRAAGASCKIVKQKERTTVIRLPSREVKEVNNQNVCTEGSVWEKSKARKQNAGASRRRGIRPSVRGVAMNPIDHPNGGKTPSGQPRTPYGKLAK